MSDLSLSTQLRIHDHLDQVLSPVTEDITQGVRAIATSRGVALSEAQVAAIATQVTDGKAPVTADMWERPASRAEWERACALAKARVRWTKRLTSSMPFLVPVMALGVAGLLQGGLLLIRPHLWTTHPAQMAIVGGLSALLAWLVLWDVDRNLDWGSAWFGERHRRSIGAAQALAPFDLRPDHLKDLLWVPGLPACLAQAMEGEVPFLKLDLLQAHDRRKAEVARRDAQRQVLKEAQRHAEAEVQTQAAHDLVRQAMAGKPIEA